MLKKIVRDLEAQDRPGARGHSNRGGFGSVSRRVGEEEQTAAKAFEGSASENSKGAKTSLAKGKTRQKASQVQRPRKKEMERSRTQASKCSAKGEMGKNSQEFKIINALTNGSGVPTH